MRKPCFKALPQDKIIESHVLKHFAKIQLLKAKGTEQDAEYMGWGKGRTQLISRGEGDRASDRESVVKQKPQSSLFPQ